MIKKRELCALLLFFTLLPSAHGELVRNKKNNAKPQAAHSAPAAAAVNYEVAVNQLDQFYRMKRIFLFPAIDDINGVIAPSLERKLNELFAKNPRFELLTDNSVIKALSPDDSTYLKIAQSESVHREAAKATQADATILLRSRTAAGKTEIILDWRDSNGVILVSESNTLPSFSSLEAQESLLAGIFADSVRHIPFEGSVTGRTGQTITIDLGDGQIAAGDTIDIARMVSVQRHPLLKTITKADFVKVGSAKVKSADRVLSFADVLEEAPNESIGIDHKIIAIRRAEKRVLAEPKPVPMYNRQDLNRQEREGDTYGKKKNSDDEWDDQFPAKKALKGDFDRPKARLGHIGVAPALGGIGHTNNSTGVSTDLSGNGIGAQLDAELWVTRDWILGLDYLYQTANLSGPVGSTPVSVGSSNWRRLDFFGAYRFLPSGRMDSTAISFGAGYQMKEANIAPNALAGTSYLKYTGILLRVDGDISLNSTNRALVGLSLVPFGSAPGLESVNSLGFNLGWSFLLDGTLWGRVTLDYDSANGSSNSGTISRSDRRYAIEPGIFYYF